VLASTAGLARVGMRIGAACAAPPGLPLPAGCHSHFPADLNDASTRTYCATSRESNRYNADAVTRHDEESTLHRGPFSTSSTAVNRRNGSRAWSTFTLLLSGMTSPARWASSATSSDRIDTDRYPRLVLQQPREVLTNLTNSPYAMCME